MADKWVNTVNKSLVMIGCIDAEKVKLVAHLLKGPVATWWNNYLAIQPRADVTWSMFQKLFRAAHVSSGVMDTHKRGFNNLRQGKHTVAEYVEAFGNLARHAPNEVGMAIQPSIRWMKPFITQR